MNLFNKNVRTSLSNKLFVNIIAIRFMYLLLICNTLNQSNGLEVLSSEKYFSNSEKTGSTHNTLGNYFKMIQPNYESMMERASKLARTVAGAFETAVAETNTKKRSGANGHLQIVTNITSTSFTVDVNGQQVTHFAPEKDQKMILGSYLVVLHKSTGHVMLERTFKTQEPLGGVDLKEALDSIQDERILIFALTPSGSAFFSPAEEVFTAQGSLLASRICFDEGLLIIRADGVINEALFIRNSTRRYTHFPSLSLQMKVPIPYTSPRCKWYLEPHLKIQAELCELYEGMMELCRCDDPITSSNMNKHPLNVHRETIPIIIVTSKKTHNFYRTLRQLVTMRGISQTPVLVSLDAIVEPSITISKLFGFTVNVTKDIDRQNGGGDPNAQDKYVRDAFQVGLQRALEVFPDVDKYIFLEDDLLLSPDFISYFQQTSWLLDNDQSIFCINAFNSHSYPWLVGDNNKLQRGFMTTQFGWMVRRTWVEEMSSNWVNGGFKGDWDYWVMGWARKFDKHVVFPEISRSLHAGLGGTHVNGRLQAQFFQNQISNQEENVTLQNIQDLTYHRYSRILQQQLSTSPTIYVSHCHNLSNPELQEGQTFVVYVEHKIPLKEVHQSALSVFLKCLRTWSQDNRQDFEGVVTIYSLKRKFHFVICPESPYCYYRTDPYISWPSGELMYESLQYEEKLLNGNSSSLVRHRAVNATLSEQRDLTNYRYRVKFIRTHVVA